MKAAVKSRTNESKGTAMKLASVLKLHPDNRDQEPRAVIKKAWDHMDERETADRLLFDSPKANIHIATLRPEQVQIWQICLGNVDPLLNVTHAPTLQAHIVGAASDVANINSLLEVHMFSACNVSILSLTENECRASFGWPRKDLLKRYQFDASWLYCTVRFYGPVITTAWQHYISTWDYKTATLAPTWDCQTSHKLNDFEIQPEMKTPRTIHNKPTEALLTVVRSELCDFLRHNAFHLDFTNPSLNIFAKVTRHIPAAEGGELITFERTMGDNYLEFCNPENPLHFITIWTTRGYLARIRLLEQYSRCSGPSMEQTVTQCNTAISYALRMLKPTPMDFGRPGMSYSAAGQAATGSVPWGYPYMPGHAPMDVDMKQLDWAAVD
ncbi:hypothetical protein DL764_008752 [Monosporascus ibericus]|uniref:Uncharacterized protein n=1 Tax=Monosporascus ibericus TaxID=155417 RepID=A0A4Q4SYY0_9PEZI|nr:hypothetical protein DL764_008752 [Monosporascus ibericus]